MDGKKLLQSQLQGLLEETLKRKSSLEKFREEYELFSHGVGVGEFTFPEESPNVNEITDGDILLLDPSLVGATRPVKVMVLSTFGSSWEGAKSWGDTPCTAISPLSPLQTPAFSCELKAEDSVLQIWNTRCVPDSHLKRCWKVGQFNQQIVDDAYDVFLHWSGKELPARLRDRVFIPGKYDDLSVNEAYYLKEKSAVDDLDL